MPTAGQRLAAKGWLWARARFIEIVFVKVCTPIYLPMYLCTYVPIYVGPYAPTQTI